MRSDPRAEPECVVGELAQELGFVYYWWLVDYENAAKWFNRAADMPNGANWLRPLAAVTLARGGNRASSRTLWNEIVRNADADWLRDQAKFRLTQLDAMDGIDLMERVVQQYRDRTGSLPGTWRSAPLRSRGRASAGSVGSSRRCGAPRLRRGRSRG